MKKLGSIVSSKKGNVLLYGQAGIGKTELIKTLPMKPEEVLYIAAEPRMLSLLPTKHNARDMSNMDVLSPKTAEDFASTLKFILEEAPKKYKLVWIDGLDQIAEDMLRLFKAREKAKGSRGDMRTAYGDMADSMVAWISDILRSPLPVVMTSHLEEDPSSDIRYTFAFPGRKAERQILNLFDEVWCMKIAKLDPLDPKCQDKRWIQTTRNRDVQYQAKEGSGLLDDFESPEHVMGKFFKER